MYLESNINLKRVIPNGAIAVCEDRNSIDTVSNKGTDADAGEPDGLFVDDFERNAAAEGDECFEFAADDARRLLAMLAIEPFSFESGGGGGEEISGDAADVDCAAEAVVEPDVDADTESIGLPPTEGLADVTGVVGLAEITGTLVGVCVCVCAGVAGCADVVDVPDSDLMILVADTVDDPEGCGCTRLRIWDDLAVL